MNDMRVLCAYALFSAIISVCVCKSNERFVTTDQGPVRGYRDHQYDEIFSFYSIPYALAPTGADRFKAPRPAPIWLQTFEAVDKGIICPQHDMFHIMTDLKMQEDCLFANIFVPDTTEEKLPVVVYVHGGAYQVGFGNLMTPKNLVRTKKMIAVTFNYRVGVHGFLCLGTKDVPGNAGMKDQVALLRWVKKHIASYGGNPDDVTIAGYSAGSSAVDLLMLSKSTRGLFHKVIPESGSNLVAWAVQQKPLENAKWFAAKLGFTNVDDVHALEKFYRTTPIEQIASDAFMYQPNCTFVFSPCVERDTGEERFLEDAPINILKEGKYPKVPLLYGFAQMEGLMRVDYGYEFWRNTINDKFSDYLPVDLQFESEADKKKVADEVKAFYFKDKAIGDDTIMEYIDYFTDMMFAYGTLRAVKLHVEAGHNQIYLYEYSYPNEFVVPGSDPKKTVIGANHCAQCVTVLDGIRNMPVAEDIMGEKSKMTQLLRTLWLNFITTGKPVPANSTLPQWPPVSSVECSPYMELNVTPRLLEGLLLQRTQFWDRIYAKYYRTPTPPPAPTPAHEDL